MDDNKRLIVLMLLMVVVALSVGGSTIGLLYQEALEEEQMHLIETVKNQARLMEAVARFDAQYSQGDHSGGAAAATLSQIEDAFAHHEGYGETSTFVMGQKEGDQIIFLAVYRQGKKISLPPVSLNSEIAIPMQRALTGGSGAMVALDSRGERVLAAYEPVSILNVGIVAQMDLTEMQEPFIETSAIALGIAFVIIVAGGVLFFRIGNPILEQIEAQNEALKESLLFNENILEQSPVGIAIYDHSGQCVLANPAIERCVGATDEAFLKQNYHHIESWRKTDLHEKALLAIKNHRPERTTISTVSTFGKSVNLACHLVPFISKERTKLLLMVDDITDKIAAEKALEESEKTVRLLLNSAAEAIYGIDLEGRCTFANPACINMLGFDDVSALLGNNMHELIHYAHVDGSPYPKAECHIYEAFQSKGVHIDNEVLWRKDGSLFPVEYWSYPIYQEEKIIGAVVTFLDITVRKRFELELKKSKEEADAANQAKSQFLACMSHEIRTPLNTIIGVADYLKEAELSEINNKMVAILNRSANGLLGLINDVLDLAKIEAGRMIIEEVDFNLDTLIYEITSIMEVEANKKKIRLKKEIDPLLPKSIQCDPKCLRQVLLNLTSNAIKFTKEGEVSIKVEPYKPADIQCLNVTNDLPMHPDTDGCYLHFMVKDTGIGISADKLDAVFESFMQADGSITRNYGGTGLGLAISKDMVALMGGQIWVDSELGKGSAFHFTVNCRPARQHLSESDGAIEAGDVVIAEVIERQQNNPRKILVVEDSEDVIALMELYFEGLPHQVDFVENGELAVWQFKNRSYDIVLMDMQMPIKDGYTATREIRRWEEKEEKNRTPIIAVTANVLRGEDQRCFSAGCSGYLSKPFKKQELLRIIGTHPPASERIAGRPDDRVRISLDADLEGLVPRFIQLRHEDIQTIRNALDKDDYEIISRLSHSMKGSGISYGFNRISEIGRAMEHAAKGREKDEVNKCLLELSAYLEKIDIAYE